MWQLIPSSASRRAPPIRPSPTLFFGLVGAFLLTLLPHVEQLPLWVTALVLVAMVVRSLGQIFRWPQPSSAFCGILALCLFGAIYWQFDTIFGREAGTAFMAALLAIKFFEIRSPRDIALILFCSFFVVMSSLLYSQAIELFIYCLIMMWVLTALLLRTSMGDLPELRVLRLLRTSTLFFAQAFPLTVFLFFFFPRYHGILQLGATDTSVGLTDKVEPGSIARLAEDDSIAMMVKVTGSGVPAPSDMYWRALVLWDFVDGAWVPGPTADPQKKEPPLPEPVPGATELTQEVTIYPHFHQWLFALDYPISRAERTDGLAGWSESRNGGVVTLRGRDILGQKERYDIVSCPEIVPGDLDPGLKRAALTLPPDDAFDAIDPAIKALADQLHQGCVTDDDYIRAVLHYFRHGNFHYSNSGPRGRTALADFLLRSKTGFCEYYASGFGVLMRLEHIPTRLVVGYQGAQYNPYKNIYVVKQSHAHCWDEVWSPSEKQADGVSTDSPDAVGLWRRIDPTAILSAREIAPGATLASAGGANEGLTIEVAHHRFTLLPGGMTPGWLRRTIIEGQLRREEIEADWDDWVFSYDTDAQSRLAQALGFGQKVRTFLALVSLLAVSIFCAVFAWFFTRRVKVPAVEKFYARFCHDFARRGLPREPWEGPFAYTGRVAQAFPETRPAAAKIGRIVARARYGAEPEPLGEGELDSLLRASSSPADGN